MASEAYAKKERNAAAKATALRNAPQTLYFDKRNKREVGQDEYNAISNVKNKPKDMTVRDFNMAVTANFPQYGKYDPVGRKSTYKPEWMLKEMGVISKEKVAKQDQQMFYYGGKQYTSLGSLYNDQPNARNDKNNIDQQTVSFDTEGRSAYGEVNFGEGSGPVEKGAVMLTNDLTKTTSNKEAKFLATEKIVKGKSVFTNVKAYTKNKPEPVSRANKGFKYDGEVGTKADLIKSGRLTEDSGYTFDRDAQHVGFFNNKFDQQGNKIETNFSPLSKDLLSSSDKTPEFTYNVIVKNKQGKLVTLQVPEGVDPITYVRDSHQDSKHMMSIRKKEDGEITYLNPDGSVKTNKNSKKINDSQKVNLISFDKSPDEMLLDPEGEKTVSFPIAGKKLDAAQTAFEVNKANIFVRDNLSRFNASPSKTNKFLLSMANLMVADYKKVGLAKDETEGSTVYKDIGEYVKRYSFISGLNIEDKSQGINMPFGEYLKMLQNNELGNETIKKINIKQKAEPQKHVVGGNSEVKVTPTVAEALNVPVGSVIRTSIVNAYDDDHKPAIEAMLNLSNGKGTKAADDRRNNLFGLTRYKPNSTELEINQPELDLLNRIVQVKKQSSKGGKVTVKNGIQILSDALNPDFNDKTLDLELSSEVASIANLLNDYYESTGGSFPKLMQVVNSVVSTGANGMRAMMKRYGKGAGSKGINDAKSASRGIRVSGGNARTEALALRKTYFGPDGKMYAEGSGLAQFYLDVDGALYVGKNLIEAGARIIKDKIGISFLTLDENTEDFQQQMLDGAKKKLNSFKRLANNAINAKTGLAHPAGFIDKENAAKIRNNKILDKITREMSMTVGTGGSPEEIQDRIKMKAFAQRNFHKYMLAYQLAAAIQGGTGGRTISDQDVENILNSFNFDIFSKPEHEIAAIDASIKMLDRLISYNAAIENSSSNGRGAYVAISADRLLSRSSGVSVTNMSSSYVASNINEIGSNLNKGSPTQANSVTLDKKAANASVTVGDFTFNKKTPPEVAYRGYVVSQKQLGEPPISIDEFKATITSQKEGN